MLGFLCLFVAMFHGVSAKSPQRPTVLLTPHFINNNEVQLTASVKDVTEPLLGVSYSVHFENEKLDYSGYEQSTEVMTSNNFLLARLERDKIVSGISFPGGKLVESTLPLTNYNFDVRGTGSTQFYFSNGVLSVLRDGKRFDVEADWMLAELDLPTDYEAAALVEPWSVADEIYLAGVVAGSVCIGMWLFIIGLNIYQKRVST